MFLSWVSWQKPWATEEEKSHTNNCSYLQWQSAKKGHKSGVGWLCTHVPSHPGRAQKIEKQNYFSSGIVHNYSRIIIFLWNTVWKKKAKWAWGVAKTLSSVVLDLQFSLAEMWFLKWRVRQNVIPPIPAEGISCLLQANNTAFWGQYQNVLGIFDSKYLDPS